MLHARNDTIVALATARGVAALAMIRMSGSDAIPIAAACFQSIDIAVMPTASLKVGFFASPAEKETASPTREDIDQVVVSLFRAPHSVTGEDVIEISCHGGDYAARRIIESLVRAGARPAEPGEFTKRGFLNGRMNLAQAEAVAELIHASSVRAQQSSIRLLKGGYSTQLEALRQEMLDLCAFIELELDFSEEDVAFAAPDRLQSLFDESIRLLSELIGSYRFGQLVRDGIEIVIGGRPNAGKSTLLNALVGFDRAIVSDIPGTTRDEIEAEVEFDGLRIRFRDTAGLRETEDAIEAEGVRRAEASFQRADALLYVYDVLHGLDAGEQDMLGRIQEQRPDLIVQVLANKVDLLDDETNAGATAERTTRATAARTISATAAQTDERLVRSLLQDIVTALHGGSIRDEAAHIVTNERHRDHLRRALEAVTKASEAWQASASGDILAFELRVALDELGSITGATTNEDVLGQIFSKFCIGK